ncbi:MAG: hypothetical protein V4519_00125 [Patescibacteria group bacterium]
MSKKFSLALVFALMASILVNTHANAATKPVPKLHVVKTQAKDWVEANSADPRAKEIKNEIADVSASIWVNSQDDFERVKDENVAAKGAIVPIVNNGPSEKGQYLAHCVRMKEVTTGTNSLIVVAPHVISNNLENPDALKLKEVSDSLMALKDKSGARMLDLTTWAEPSSELTDKIVTMAKLAGIEHADGFVLNLGKDDELSIVLKQAEQLSKLLKKKCVIDVSLAGKKVNGKATIGPKPTLVTGNQAVSAFIRFKVLGENDQGKFDPDAAIALIKAPKVITKK